MAWLSPGQTTTAVSHKLLVQGQAPRPLLPIRLLQVRQISITKIVRVSWADLFRVASENVAPETLAPPSYSWSLSPLPSTTSKAQLGSSAPQSSSSLLPSTQAVPISTSVIAAALQQSSLSTIKMPHPTQISTQISSSTVAYVGSSPPFFNTTQTSVTASGTSSSCGVDTGRFTINVCKVPGRCTFQLLTVSSLMISPIFRRLLLHRTSLLFSTHIVNSSLTVDMGMHLRPKTRIPLSRHPSSRSTITITTQFLRNRSTLAWSYMGRSEQDRGLMRARTGSMRILLG